MKRDLLHRRGAGCLQRWRLLQALRTEERGLVTGLLVAFIVLLLVGIAMQLPSPASPALPDSFTEVPYSTLLERIRAGHVSAANMQGNSLNALQVPVGKAASAAGAAREDAAFSNCLPENVTGCFDDEEQPLFSRTRVLFTRVPEQELPRLLALLLRHRVVVTIVQEYAPAPLAPILWRVMPLLTLLVLLGTDMLERWKW